MTSSRLLAAAAAMSFVVSPAFAGVTVQGNANLRAMPAQVADNSAVPLDQQLPPLGSEVSSSVPAVSAAATASAGGGGGLLLGLGLAAIGAAVAGGGGHSSSGSTTTTTTTPPLAPPTTTVTPTTGTGGSVSSFETSEYYASGGLAQTNAAYQYAKGAYGLNTLISVYDSGADVNNPDLAANINSSLSHSYFTNDANVTDTVGHGTHVAGIIAGVHNGYGIEGISWGSKLMILQGLGNTAAPSGSYSDGIDRSVAAGAVAMNNSWTFVDGSNKSYTIDQFSSASEIQSFLGSAIINSLDAAAKAGMVSVFAAGNDGSANASLMAGLPKYFPELDGSILGVAAVDSHHQIASWSNRCGQAMNYCIAAPGVNILSTYPTTMGDHSGYATMSGTSMATPYVTGAIGVLKSEFPELTGQQIVQILENSATDLGTPGVDPIYGHGELNLTQALKPAGTLTVQTSSVLDQGAVPASKSMIVASGGIAGALKAALSSRTMVVTDAYDRGYHVSAGSFVANGTQGTVSADRTAAFALGENAATKARMDGASLSVSTSGAQAITGSNWVDSAAMKAPYLASLGTGSSFDYQTKLGNGLSLGVSRASGTETTGSTSADYVAASLRASIGQGSLSITLGRLNESGGFLGASVNGAFGSDLASRTNFLQIGAAMPLGADTALQLTAASGNSAFASTGLLRSGTGIGSNAFGVGLTKVGLLAAGDRFSIGISQPISMSSGTMTVALPTALGAASGNVRSHQVMMTTSSVEVKNTAAPTDLQVGYSIPAGAGRLRAGLIYSNGTFGGASVGWSVSF